MVGGGRGEKNEGSYMLPVSRAGTRLKSELPVAGWSSFSDNKKSRKQGRKERNEGTNKTCSMMLSLRMKGTY